MRSVVKKIVYNDRIIAVELQAEAIYILMMQVYMPTSEHEDEEVDEFNDIIEEILEEDGKVNTNTIIRGTRIMLLEMNHIGILLGHMT